MLNAILPEEILDALDGAGFSRVEEIRVRVNSPVLFCANAKFYKSDVTATKGMINDIVAKASNYSLYTVNDQICKGFLTIQGGVRIGVSGDVVYEDGRVLTIKNISALNIRVPHEVNGCALKVLKYLLNKDGNLLNTLVIAPPGAGKTTFLRDLCRNLKCNVLLLDERCELASFFDGEPMLDVGDFADIYSNCSKEFGFNNGIRSMRPDVIVTDEVGGVEDILSIYKAVKAGVSVVASVHASNIDDVNEGLKVFDRYIVLSSRNGSGTIEEVLDKCLNRLY